MAALPVYQSRFLWEPTDDAFYYYARTNEVLNGLWQIGNPYYFEHRLDLGTSFIVPDWLSVVPGAFFTWPLINAVLIYAVLKFLEVKGWKLYLGTAFCYVTVLCFIARPTSLSTIYPFFLLFFLALLKYLKSNRNIVFLVLTSAATFYVYPYLWQIVVTALGLLLLFRKGSRWFLAVPILAAPALFYFWLQISSPFYFETMERVGLVYTRIPTVETFWYFGIMTGLMFFLRKNMAFVILYVAFSLILFSPVVSGKELEIASHLGRFIALFGAIGIVVLISKANTFLVLAVVWLMFFYKNYIYLGAAIVDPPKLPEVNIPTEAKTKTVIKAKGRANYYIPFMTNSYVLFHPLGLLHLMSSDEALERYLVWKYPDKITEETLVRDFRLFAGAGPGAHVIGHHNYHVRICRLLHLGDCGEFGDLRSYYGQAYFQKILDRYYSEISPNISEYYRKYHVDFSM